MNKRKVLIIAALVIAVVVAVSIWFVTQRSSVQQSFESNLEGVVTDTLTFPWAQWSDIASSIDPAAPETVPKALEEYFTAKYGDRVAQSGVTSLVNGATFLYPWNMSGAAEVTVKDIEIVEWLPTSAVCLFKVVVEADGKEYILDGRAQMTPQSRGQLSYCAFSGDGFYELVEAGASYLSAG